tara:strand:- start:6867 stop:7997 length:1131 start_codon:yes stop_codon:yes gene_type:complete
MARKPSLWLMLTMLMFPQVVETIYSPALNGISEAFSVSAHQASQTLSIYFAAFSFGVVTWGILADKWGRRATMIAGLIVYGLSALTAMLTNSFALLLFARATSAFGVAVGSVVTQTMLRDSFSGEELGKVFALMGIGLSISPILGMATGGLLVELGGYQWVFASLCGLAVVLLILNLIRLPETQVTQPKLKLSELSKAMIKDRRIWQAASLVALFNIALFAYYQLGGFHFKQMGLSAQQFGYSGLLLGVGTLIGSLVNKSLLKRGVTTNAILNVAASLLVIGALGVLVSISHIWFVVPMVLVVMSFGIAIPNILSNALVEYKQYVGSAGALFGLLYYLMIGGGLALSGLVQHLGYVLLACAMSVSLMRYFNQRKPN